MKKLITTIPFVLLLFLASMFFSSCKPNFSTISDVDKYINNPENNLISLIQKQGVETKIAWQPWQILAFSSADQSSIRGDSMNKYCFFILSFSKDNKELLRQLNYSLYSELVPIFSFSMQKYVTLRADSNEAIEPVDCFFQQTYGSSNANKVLLVFNKKEIETAKVLNLSIGEFGLGLGKLDFNIETKNMDLITNLDYNKMRL